MIPSFENNRLLAVLADGNLRQADMQEIALEPKSVLFEPNQPIIHVYFPLTGIVSLMVEGEDGGDVEVATIGNEGAAGLGGLLSGDVSFSRQVVQLGGQAVRIARAPFLVAVNQSRRMRGLLAAHADAFTGQLMQSASCNARHDVEQRLARWLLTVADRSGQTSLHFTHHAVAELLGVQRPTVTLAARMMQSAGLIDYRRGTLAIVDRSGLTDVACECYRIIRQTYDAALQAETSDQVTGTARGTVVLPAMLCKNALVVPAGRLVALAGDLLQPGPVDDRNRTARGFQNLGRLQAAHDKSDGRAAHAERDSEIVVGQVDAVGAAAVERHEQPAGHPLFG